MNDLETPILYIFEQNMRCSCECVGLIVFVTFQNSVKDFETRFQLMVRFLERKENVRLYKFLFKIVI